MAGTAFAADDLTAFGAVDFAAFGRLRVALVVFATARLGLDFATGFARVLAAEALAAEALAAEALAAEALAFARGFAFDFTALDFLRAALVLVREPARGRGAMVFSCPMKVVNEAKPRSSTDNATIGEMFFEGT